MSSSISLHLALLSLVALCAPHARAAETVDISPNKQLSIVRVSVTSQPYDFRRPWGKRNPYSRKAVGAVLANERVLVTAELIANANYLEFEAAEGGQKVPASVEAVDYESNLALLKTSDPTFLKALKPLELTIAHVGDELAVWQLEANGNQLITRGTMTNADVARYPIDDSMLLMYRLTVSLQFRDAAFTMPVVKAGKLVGVLTRYDPQTSNGDVIPTPVIEHFLRDVAQAPYKGFPKAGLSYSGTRDPQLRRFAGLKESKDGGVYVTDVFKPGPAAAAGIEKGDVILRVDDTPVDQDGNYNDPTYGKIALAHLLSTRHFVGDALKFSLLRNGTPKDVTMTLTHRAPESFMSPPYIMDHAPRFYIFGGLVLQELSRQYLREFGNDWWKKAPEELVHLDRQQNELSRDGTHRVIFLNRVLPSDSTVGYEELNHLVVSKINGVELKSLNDIPAALEKVVDGVHKIEFTSDPGTIYLDAEQVVQSEAILAKTYRLPTLKRLE
jgi:S1-C subfamily serine protease